MRNLFLHSGGHWNSKAVKDSRKINKIFSSINSDENEKKKVPQEKSIYYSQISNNTENSL